MNIALCARVRSLCTSRKQHGRHIDFRMGCRAEKKQTKMRPYLIPTRLPSPMVWRCFLAHFLRRHNIPRPTANNSIILNLCVSSSSLFFFSFFLFVLHSLNGAKTFYFNRRWPLAQQSSDRPKLISVLCKVN